MKLNDFNRRDFIKGSASTLALSSLPGGVAHGQAVGVRPEWQQFRLSPNYTQFVNAVRLMRANTNAADRRSWTYWVNSHRDFCPHGVPYFFAWHRGYIYYFEQTLRAITGNSAFMLPYWDYYRFPTMPSEFTTPSTNNPLYVNRVNTNVSRALTLSPFPLTNFQRGAPNAFETSFEPNPHGQVHNLIGGVMASLLSPTDPIFWLHHCQVDRLLHAWVLSGGKQYPGPTTSYWAGTLAYSSNLTIARNAVYNPANLGYTYQDNTLPRVLPPQAAAGGLKRATLEGRQSARIMRVQLESPPSLPPTVRLPNTPARPTSDTTRSIGGVQAVTLGESSISTHVPLPEQEAQALESLSRNTRARTFPPRGSARGFTSAQVVLDNIRVTPAGQFGGYFYEVYLNLPPNSGPSVNQETYLVGSFGPFEVSSALHHGQPARLAFPATQLLQNFTDDQIKLLTVSFVRVSGDLSPRGAAILVGEMRIELSTKDPE